MNILAEGQVIRDTYEVERYVGEGAFAEVYRVKHRFLGRQAMKVFKRVGMDLGEIQDMLSEAILLSRINHPNIVRVFDAGVLETPKGTCGFFTMENVSGGSLDKFWRSYGARFVPIDTVVDVVKQICRGIAQAHREKPPVIHRDIKPQNILVGYEADGLRVRVSDFGLAKKVNPLTLLATAAGTPIFKPPEAFAQQKGDSCASDVWGIGVTLYLLLTDRLPFNISNGATWGTKHLFETPLIPPSEINPDVGEVLNEVILKALERRPQDRFPSAKEFLEAMERWTPSMQTAASRSGSRSNESTKAMLGMASPVDENQALALLKRAFNARQAGRLADAADLMEEAFNKSPDLREKYAHQVKLWRCGISM